MVNLDWNRVMAIKPEGLSEHDKDDLFESVAWYVPESNLDRRHLIHFVRICQEVLKFKAEQVESLMNELDDIASKQGEDEARRRQDLIEEMEDLKEQLEYFKRLDRDNTRPTLKSGEELRSEIVKLEMQNEELLYELKERERELMNEKTEVENYASQVATLEREKLELSRELNALQEETTEKLNAKSLRDSPEFGPEKQEELTETIRRKNKHISQLLDDIEAVEKENLSLRTKLSSVRDELSEATTHINDMTKDLSKLKHFNDDYEKKVTSLEEQNQGLTMQIEELVEEKSKHDKQLDEFAVTLNLKVQEWKSILDHKDTEIIKLKEELRKVMPSSNMMMSSDMEELELQQKVAEQEEQIQTLKNELLKATEEINSSCELIEKLKQKENLKTFDSDQPHSLLNELEGKIAHLEDKLKYAEQDAHLKAEEMSDLVIQLREYEAGEFGLSEAVSKIKKLEKSILKKDCQIEQLIENSNHLEIEFENLEEQNMALREKLGISASEEIDTSQVKLKFKKDVQMMESLKVQLEKKEEDLLKVKLKNRKLIKLLRRNVELDASLSGSDDSKSTKTVRTYKQENSELENRLLSAVKENDALRKGMHEILESIHAQDCSGTVQVESYTLERLLEALDSRHVSGWYHPAMRLQAQLNSIVGKNEELRNQIRSLRAVQIQKSDELEEAYQKIQTLQNDLLMTPKPEESIQAESARTKEVVVLEEEEEEQEVEEEEEDEIDANPNSKTPSVMNIEQEQKMIELEMELQELKLIYDKKINEGETLERNFKSDKEDFLTKIEGLEKKIQVLENQNPENKEAADKFSLLIVLERKVSYLKDVASMYISINEKLRDSMIESEEKMLRDMVRLQREKLVKVIKVEKLEKQLLGSVSKQKFDALSEELSCVSAKYQHAVNLALTKYDDNILEKLQSEINMLQSEKQCILDELRIAKEKLIIDGISNSDNLTKGAFNDEVSILAGKLAASEVREMNEKQKSSHLEKVNIMIRSEQQELEAHNKELTDYINKLMEQNSKLEKVERDLQTKMQNFKSEEEFSSLLEKHETLEVKYKELLTEKENVQELFEISQDQCRSLQNWREMNKLAVTSKNEQFLMLQSSSDDKATISRLSHEILTAQLIASQLSKTNCDLQNKVSKLLTKNMCLETNIDEYRREIFELKLKHLADMGYLHEIIGKVRHLYSNVTIFPDIESVYKLKSRFKQEENEIGLRLNELKIKIQEYTMKREELEIQLDSLQDLKKAMRGETNNLMTWHNKTTELRLKEGRCRRQNEYLVGEMVQLENCMKNLNEEIMSLEEKIFEKEKDHEQKQIIWENSQLELYRVLRDRGIKRPAVIAHRQQSADTETQTAPPENTDHLWKIINEQDEKVKKYEGRIGELEAEIRKMNSLVEEKEAIILLKEKLTGNVFSKPKTLELEETVSRDKTEETEKTALKVTVQSLQNIITQKEETIFRYQDLLKEGREEHAKAAAKLQEELRTLHDTLNSQSKTINRLKSNAQEALPEKDNTPLVVEKYICRIHELEDELTENQSNLSSLNSQLFNAQQEAEKWRSVAGERLFLMDDMQQRLEIEYKNEIDSFKEEIQNYQGEVDHLKQLLDSTQEHMSDGHNRKLVGTIQQLQMKLIQYEGNSSKNKANLVLEHALRSKNQKEIESLKRQLKAAKEESSRLREQIRVLQMQRARKPRTGSATTRSTNSLKEESLQSKVKTLEELLQISKDRERELLESSQQRIKSAEEVARWDEKKRSQQLIDQLHTKIREREVEIDVLKNKNESFRNMIHKIEREKKAVEAQLKAGKGSSINGRIEKLTADNSRLETEVASLKEQLELQLRHEGGIGAALLHEKLESQERKLAVLELASQGNSCMVDELERLKSHISNLEKTNLKLESENLSLELKLEKERAEARELSERMGHLQKLASVREADEEASEACQIETSKKILKLEETIKKLNAEKQLRASEKDLKILGPNDRSRKEFLKLKEDHKKLRSQYCILIERNKTLEEELKKCQYQIHLLEEKDLVESIAKTNNLQLASDLSQELLQVKSQLAHKTHLLERVKTLLTKAAAKERALNEQVSVLKRLVPQSAAHKNV